MGVANILTNLRGAYGSITKQSLPDYSTLETCDGPTIISKDGSLSTIIRVDGIRQMAEGEEIKALIEKTTSKMSSYFNRKGHAIQVWFSRDPDLAKPVVNNLMVPARTVAKRLDMKMDDLFEDRERTLPRHIVHESNYMVLWTRPTILSPKEIKKMKGKMKAPPLWPAGFDTQNIFLAGRELMVRHRSFVDSFLRDLSQWGIRAEALGGHDAIRAVRESVYPDTFGSKWRPHLVGDRYTKKTSPHARGQQRAQWARYDDQGKKDDMSHLLWPRLDDQLFERDAEVISPNIVRIGRYNFASTDLTVGPQDLLPFSALLNNIRGIEEFPWRMSFLIEGDGLSSFGIKKLLTAVAGWSNSENKQIRQAIQALSEYKSSGGVVVRFRASFATWAPAENVPLIEDRINQLQRAVEGWGYCSVSPGAGDPLSGVMSSALGLDVRSTAPTGAPPLSDVNCLIPWMRDASPFKWGSVLFRTPDGRPWPYQPGSNKQDTFIDIVYAPPGKGKSVWLNTTNLSFCLSPTATSGAGGAMLPRIAIIDIGPSSSGLISLLKEALPPSRKHEVAYKRLRMVAEHAINPWDTQLGCRKPLPLDRAFLVNFLTLLGTPVGQTKAPPNLSDLVGMAIDELYEKFSDLSKKGDPRGYTSGVDNLVDEAIEKYSISLNPDMPTWWECVDRLFEAGAYREASLAQRHAVPRMEDLMVIRTPQIMDVFGTAMANDNQTLVDNFQMVISSVLREYPILTQPTRFDLGEARVVSLDLDEAAPRGGGPADKQTSVVYMLARFILARDFYLTTDNIARTIPELYLAYHEQRIRRLRETPKRIVFDELHRTKSSPIVRDQIRIDMREGRKWGVQVALASQLLTDFDEDMLSLATGYWIMGVNTEPDAKKAREMFGLSRTAEHAIVNELRGPGRGGAPFLAVLQMKDGKHEHLLYNTLGPTELWAFSTTAQDVALRERLYGRLGALRTRKILSKQFPDGSAKEEIDRRVVERAERGETTAEANAGVVEELASELYDLAQAA